MPDAVIIRIVSRILIPAVCLSCLAGCVRTTGTAAFGTTPDGPNFTKPGEDEGEIVQPGGNLPLNERPTGFTPEEDIVFTDPDNPDATLPELSGILTDPARNRGPWERDIRVARKTSIREGRPLLIWFTDSSRSPRCKQLAQELLDQPDFQKWASENLIRMRVDESEEFDESELSLGQAQSLRVEFAAYVRKLKNHYKVLGYPSMVLVDPQGRVIAHYRGFKKGDADMTWGRIRQGVAVSNHATKAWRQQLEAKGYREWEDRRGRKLLARLLRYNEGELHVVEPDGTRSVIQESQLCARDLRWIREQKAQRR